MPALKTVQISHDDWLKEAERRYGRSPRDWRFTCPACGHKQSGQDFLDAGLKPEQAAKYLAFSCVGRFIPGSRDAFTREENGDQSGPCNYAGGGLFRIAPIAVDTGNDEPVYAFDFADEPLA